LSSPLTEPELADVYARYGALLLRRCRHLLGDGPAAEDTLHEAFVKIWRYGRSYRDAASPLAWLYRTVDRCCFDALAARARRGEQPIDDVIEAPVHARDRVSDWQIVRLFLHQFDDRLQQIAVLHWVDEMSQEEIAAAVGWSRQTVAKKLELLRERAAALGARLSDQEARA
jgi:RNA polymerase sigma-70 factor (ECF subfamily)